MLSPFISSLFVHYLVFFVFCFGVRFVCRPFCCRPSFHARHLPRLVSSSAFSEPHRSKRAPPRNLHRCESLESLQGLEGLNRCHALKKLTMSSGSWQAVGWGDGDGKKTVMQLDMGSKKQQQLRILNLEVTNWFVNETFNNPEQVNADQRVQHKEPASWAMEHISLNSKRASVILAVDLWFDAHTFISYGDIEMI